MCSPDLSTRPRGGALAALQPTPDNNLGFYCDLTFHTPGSPSSPTATHLRVDSKEICDIKDMRLIIHQTGELDKPASECGCLSEFSVCPVVNSLDLATSEAILSVPITIGVGGDGVIGRRVSLLVDGSHVAQGIIGFNF